MVLIFPFLHIINRPGSHTIQRSSRIKWNFFSWISGFTLYKAPSIQTTYIGAGVRMQECEGTHLTRGLVWWSILCSAYCLRTFHFVKSSITWLTELRGTSLACSFQLTVLAGQLWHTKPLLISKICPGHSWQLKEERAKAELGKDKLVGRALGRIFPVENLFLLCEKLCFSVQLQNQ